MEKRTTNTNEPLRIAPSRYAGDAPDLEAARQRIAHRKGLIPEEPV
jgi:hypothetical protein